MVVKNGRIKQSIAHWCLNTADETWDVEKTCQVAKQLGCPAVELIDPEDWHIVKRHGLTCASNLIGMPGAPFVKGYNNPLHHEELITRSKQMIDKCQAAGFPNILGFTGMKWRDAEDPNSGEISPEEGADNCVAGLQQIAPYAEQHNVTICIEHLNTRVADHPMKGHPGYQGDDVEYVASIIRRVGSENVKLLFDVYHVQVMHGDILTRLEECHDILGHLHVAGVPGRGELNHAQEINFPAIMQKLLDMGYEGYVGQEFIPAGDPLEGLTQAVDLCDL